MPLTAGSTGFTDTLHVTLCPSVFLRSASALGYAVALAVVLVLAWSRPVFWIGVAMLLFLAVRNDRILGLRRRTAPTQLRWSASHQLHWRTVDGTEHTGECVQARSWGAFWVRLKAREAPRRLATIFVIPRDAVDAQVHRQLRAKCRVMPPERH